MKVEQLVDAMNAIAPPAWAEPWDRVGLQVGAADWPAARIRLAIDLTEPVLDEAIDAGTDVIVAYHPLVFEPIAALTDAQPKARIALRAARAGIAVLSPHTALDAAPAGVNDWIAHGLGEGDVRALAPAPTLPESEELKVVTFCPASAADSIRNALASIGAGRIGAYERCSFELRGTGTFHAGDGTSPAVGRRGVLERVDEVRLEMVCPRRSLPLAVTMLRQAHPYEEPPIEVYALEARPQRAIGAGRRVVLDQKIALREIVDRLKKRLGVKHLRAATAYRAPRRYGVVGVCAGAGGGLLADAIAQGCELFVTGEMRHHDVLDAQARGCTIVLAGHTNTERGYLKVLRTRLVSALPGATAIELLRKDVDPLAVV